MKKVLVIGAGNGLDVIEKAKKTLELKGEVEIICVESMKGIPFNKHIKSDPSVIQQIHEFNALHKIEVAPYFDDKKRKGHERPYKYHR